MENSNLKSDPPAANNGALVNTPKPAATPARIVIRRPAPPPARQPEHPRLGAIFIPGDDQDEYSQLRGDIHSSFALPTAYQRRLADRLTDRDYESTRYSHMVSGAFLYQESVSGPAIDAKYEEIPAETRQFLIWDDLHLRDSFRALIKENHCADGRFRYQASTIINLLPDPKSVRRGE